METRIISIVNQKGGVGKTTSTVNIAASLSALNKKVLVIDLDPQGNLSQSIGIQSETLENTVYQLLREIATFDEVVYKHEKFDVIPANIGLSAAELELSGAAGREFLLKEGLDQINKGTYDYILIDCSPSLGVLTLNALVASQEVFIPVQTQFLSMQGISQLIKTIEVVKDRLNKKIEITGVILTMFDSRKKLNNEVCKRVEDYFDNLVFKTRINDSVSLAEAPSHGMDILEYSIASKGAKNYLALTKEIIKMKTKRKKDD
jgi:chromosome partitioning protein